MTDVRFQWVRRRQSSAVECSRARVTRRRRPETHRPASPHSRTDDSRPACLPPCTPAPAKDAAISIRFIFLWHRPALYTHLTARYATHRPPSPTFLQPDDCRKCQIWLVLQRRCQLATVAQHVRPVYLYDTVECQLNERMAWKPCATFRTTTTTTTANNNKAIIDYTSPALCTPVTPSRR